MTVRPHAANLLNESHCYQQTLQVKKYGSHLSGCCNALIQVLFSWVPQAVKAWAGNCAGRAAAQRVPWFHLEES
jgi:hypothetical protein